MTARTLKNTKVRNRRRGDPSVPGTITPAVISEIETVSATTVRLSFNTRVFKNKLPGFTAGAGGAETVASATEISATVVELVFSGLVSITTMIVEAGDAGIRTPAGGFVPAGMYQIPEAG